MKKINQLSCFITHEDDTFDSIEFDSRSILSPSKTLFICLSGNNTDGHQYIQTLIKQGVRNFLISDKTYISDQANFYLSKEGLSGFQKVAGLIRSKFEGKIIAITGSNGKTIVKEWLAQILSIKYNVAKSPKSYNSQIGVAYSISQLKGEDLGIIECGISHPEEMQILESFVKPELGIFTNIGDAHSSGFASKEEKIKEKASLFIHSQKVICRDTDYKALQQFIPKERLINWGTNGKYKINTTLENKNTIIKVNDYQFKTVLNDEASLENLCHCIVYALEQKLEPKEIQYGIDLLKSIPMRLELKQGFDNNLILNDSYNNDIAGLKFALDQAKRIDKYKKRTLIVSEIIQVNEDRYSTKESIKNLINDFSKEEVFFVGKNTLEIQKEVSNSHYFNTTNEVITYLKKHKKQNHFYILKGARQFAFETIVEVLEQKQHLTRIEVNLSTLISNLNFYKSKLSTGTKIMAMVKAFAYGSGIVEVAKLLEIQTIDYLAVAYTDEGIILREAGIKTPIMVMNPNYDDLNNLIEFNLEPEVFSLEQMQFFYSQTKELKLHIKLDTGMHRLGFDKNSFNSLLEFLKSHPDSNIVSCLSHLAGADSETHDEYTQNQIDLFSDMTLKIEQILSRKVTKHILNSAGIERHNSAQFDMVRLGIGLYGFGTKEGTPLRQCITLKTTISQIRTLQAHETVGYSRTGILTKETKIATLPIGYADGYDRRFSQGKGSVMINGSEAYVVGNVCMDMTMVDVTNIDCKAGNEVTIYDSNHSVDDLAKRIGTISYELLTHLSERVRRVFFFE